MGLKYSFGQSMDLGCWHSELPQQRGLNYCEIFGPNERNARPKSITWLELVYYFGGLWNSNETSGIERDVEYLVLAV